MKFLIFVIVVVVGGYFLSQKLGLLPGSGGKVEIVDRGGGKALIATVDDGKADFAVGEAAVETYMMFGGDAAGDSASHGSVSGVPLKTAARIMKRYPDFHLCDSPGAAEGKNASEDVKIIAAPGEVRSRLKTLVAEHESRIAAKGERLCAILKGNWLTLNHLEKGGNTITAEQIAAMVPGGATKQYYFHALAVDMRDCKDLM